MGLIVIAGHVDWSSFKLQTDERGVTGSETREWIWRGKLSSVGRRRDARSLDVSSAGMGETECWSSWGRLESLLGQRGDHGIPRYRGSFGEYVHSSFRRGCKGEANV